MPAVPRASTTSSLSPEREEAELRDYLGASYDRGRLERYQQTLANEFDACGDEERFYRESEGYLYNLTAFAMTGTKLPYLRALERLVAPGARLLDYGCGIGSDGLMLLEAGYRVEFADFANPSTEFLSWRQQRRGLDAPIHDLDREVPSGFDASYAFDVIEHVPDAFEFLSEMERRSRIVLVNLLEPEPDDQELHHELPIRAIVDYARRSGLRYYRVFYGRSHLVAYEPGGTGPLDRAKGYGRLGVEDVRRRVERLRSR